MPIWTDRCSAQFGNLIHAFTWAPRLPVRVDVPKDGGQGRIAGSNDDWGAGMTKSPASFELWEGRACPPVSIKTVCKPWAVQRSPGADPALRSSLSKSIYLGAGSFSVKGPDPCRRTTRHKLLLSEPSALKFPRNALGSSKVTEVWLRSHVSASSSVPKASDQYGPCADHRMPRAASGRPTCVGDSSNIRKSGGEIRSSHGNSSAKEPGAP